MDWVLAIKVLTLLSWLGSQLSLSNLRTSFEQNTSVGTQHGQHDHVQQTHHKTSWKLYEEVDNLRNDDILVFIFSATTQSGYLRHDRYC